MNFDIEKILLYWTKVQKYESVKTKFKNAVKEIYDTIKDNPVDSAHLVGMLNLVGWKYFEDGIKSNELYFELYKIYNNKCLRHFKGEDFNTYFELID